MSLGPRIDNLEQPQTMTDAIATKLGHKQYLHGVVYNGGNSPTVTPSSGSVAVAKFIPYQTSDGSWRLRFFFRVTGIATNAFTVTVNSVSVSYPQSFSATLSSGTPDYATGFGLLESNSTFYLAASTAVSERRGFGDIELASKPSWAY